MGCPSRTYIGDTFTFSVNTHDPDTGALTDATNPPTYSIFEDDTAVAIATGSMTKISTGFYLKKLTATAGVYSGGKTYTVEIEATVNADAGGITYAMQVEDPARLLLLDFTGLTVTATRCMLNALRFLRNKWALSGTTLSVKCEDDSVEAWSAEVTTSASADPITSCDPAGP